MSVDFAVRGLVVSRGSFTLGPLDLEVTPGEYMVLVGPSGSGKTMLVETLLGWNAPEAGAVLLDGTPVGRLRPADRRCAYLPQDLGILPHLSVSANLSWGLACSGGHPAPGLFERVVEVLHLAPFLERRDPATLSRGEQQRVALGRALLTRPRRLLLDEPCAAVDPHRRRELQLLLKSLHREFGTTVLHVTHDREEAFLLGQRVAVLLAGQLHQVATPSALYARPADAAVARFVAPENLWPCRILATDGGSTTVRLAGTGIDLVLDPRPEGRGEGPLMPGRGTDGRAGERRLFFAGIRPEEVMILDPERPLRPQVARNVLAGTVAELLRLDGGVQVVVACEAGLLAASRLSACAAEDLGLAAGAPVKISLKARSVYLVAESA